MPHRVSQPEGHPAYENEAEDDPQQRAHTQRQLGIAPAIFGLLALRFLVVKVSPHRPPNKR
jgi:hypothetical protein